ncbi:hypothetical protein AGOR_G00056490 [Albula goreensis]|uniref:Uncharacterized protein n=1 Tax=Albula goreensis TaxID=1534307 RepID=A0A8T3DZ29_9TELE|nr:hypothetical protein AGOR_G00056490 [Albula goreensis]
MLMAESEARSELYSSFTWTVCDPGYVSTFMHKSRSNAFHHLFKYCFFPFSTAFILCFFPILVFEFASFVQFLNFSCLFLFSFFCFVFTGLCCLVTYFACTNVHIYYHCT